MKKIQILLLIFCFCTLNSCAIFKKSINGIYVAKIDRESEISFNTENILPQKSAKFVEYYQSNIVVVWYDAYGNEMKVSSINGTYLGKGYVLTSSNLKISLNDSDENEYSIKYFFKNQEIKIIIDENTKNKGITLLRFLNPDSIKFDETPMSRFLSAKLIPPKTKLELNVKIFDKVYFVDAEEYLLPTYFIREGKIMAFIQQTGFFILNNAIGPRSLGSLVFNKEGNCVGIVGGRMNYTNEAVVIPAVYIKNFLNGRFGEVFEK